MSCICFREGALGGVRAVHNGSLRSRHSPSPTHPPTLLPHSPTPPGGQVDIIKTPNLLSQSDSLPVGLPLVAFLSEPCLALRPLPL